MAFIHMPMSGASKQDAAMNALSVDGRHLAR